MINRDNYFIAEILGRKLKKLLNLQLKKHKQQRCRRFAYYSEQDIGCRSLQLYIFDYMVIQRWQSVLLLIATVAMACFTFMPIAQIQSNEFTLSFSSLGFIYEGESTQRAPTGYYDHTWLFFIISIISAFAPLASIFLFRNLKLQTSLCYVSILFVIAAFCYGLGLGISTVADSQVGWNWTVFLVAPILAIMGELMAIRYIRRDNARLKAVDRIR